jgi:thiol-disulfide isomerase/thioredoxin
MVMKNNKKEKINLLLSILAIVISLCTLAVSILMINQLSKIVKTNKEDTIKLTEKYNKLYTEIYGVPEYDVSMFNEIKAKDIKKLSSDDKIIVMITRSTCGYCAMFAPVLADIQKDYKLEINYIDIAKVLDYENPGGGVLDEEADEILRNLSTNEKGSTIMESYGATPLLLIIKNNKIINGQVGYSDYSSVESIIKEEGYKKR